MQYVSLLCVNACIIIFYHLSFYVCVSYIVVLSYTESILIYSTCSYSYFVCAYISMFMYVVCILVCLFTI